MFRVSRREFLLAGLLAGQRYATLAGIRFEIWRNGKPVRRFLLIHGNEETAREVLLARMRSGRPGLAYLVTGHERYVRIGAIQFDPNRIFSREGAERNLRQLNPRLGEADIRNALAWLDRERPKLLRAVLPEPGRLLIALHNNSEGYSVRDEIPISDEVSLNDPAHPREFLLCTQVPDYALLSRSRFNVVLQNRAPKEDDGSLSRLAARLRTRYVNIEAALGRYEEQRAMLDHVEQTLPLSALEPNPNPIC